MSTAQKCRYLLAAGAALLGIGLLTEGVILTGIFCLIGAVLLLPILYQMLYIDSNEVQLLSPVAFLAVALFSFAMYNVVPKPYVIPLKMVYTDTVAQTVGTAMTTTPSPTLHTTTATIRHTTSETVASFTTATTSVPTGEISITTTQTSAVMTTASFATSQTSVNTRETVYRTPSGKRYHLDPDCGGVNSYEVSLEDAVEVGLTPCKKCASG